MALADGASPARVLVILRRAAGQGTRLRGHRASGSSDWSNARRTGIPTNCQKLGEAARTIVVSTRLVVVAAPEVRYAKTPDGVHLAFVVLGSGVLDVVEVGNGTNMSIEAAYDEPRWEAYLAALGSFARLIRFDPRGIGLSDPLGTSGATIEQYATTPSQ